MSHLHFNHSWFLKQINSSLLRILDNEERVRLFFCNGKHHISSLKRVSRTLHHMLCIMSESQIRGYFSSKLWKNYNFWFDNVIDVFSANTLRYNKDQDFLIWWKPILSLKEIIYFLFGISRNALVCQMIIRNVFRFMSILPK